MTRTDLLLLGDSLTQFHDWSRLGVHHNAGIAGDTTDGVLRRLYYTLERQPQTLVLQIGINDLLQGHFPETIQENYVKLFEQLQVIETVIIVSLLPVEMNPYTEQLDEHIIKLNHFLKKTRLTYGFVYLDLYRLMVDHNGGIRAELTSDGLHLTPEAYTIWEEALSTVIRDGTSVSSSR